MQQELRPCLKSADREPEVSLEQQESPEVEG